MTQDLQAIIDANSGGASHTPLARAQPIPYADLNALNQPGDLPQISPALLSTLAILVAQGNLSPKLLKVDDAGSLRVASRLNTITRLTAPLPALATVAQVLDTSGLFPGDHVALITDGNPNVDCVDVVVKKIDSPTQVEFVATCNAVGFQPGDWLIGEQVVNIRQIFEAVDISDRAARLLGQTDVTDRAARQLGFVTAGLKADTGFQMNGATGSVSGDFFSYIDNNGDRAQSVRMRRIPSNLWQSFSFGAGQTPLVTFTANPGFAIVIDDWEATLNNVSGAAGFSVLCAFNSTGAGAKQIWGTRLSCTATNNTNDKSRANSAHLSTVAGQGLTIGYGAALPAGYGADISYAWHIE